MRPRNVKNYRWPAPHGSILLLVLVVVAILTLGTATYLELMQNERRAVRHHGRGVKATRLAESGVEYLKTVLALTDEEISLEGGLTDNPRLMQAVEVDVQPDASETGLVTIVAPAQFDGFYRGFHFGLENESAKLNLNALLAKGAESQASGRLMALPGMTLEIADAILDWLDADDAPRPNGAEGDAYSDRDPAYVPRNGPITALDELLMVRGVTPELLYGVDHNRNMWSDDNEEPRGVLTELENEEGVFDRGWSAYLTTTSIESMRSADGAALVDLNSQDLRKLYSDLGKSLTDEQAKFVILFRQNGAQPATPAGPSSGAGRPAGGAAAVAPGARPVAGQPGASTVKAETVELNFEKPGSVQFGSPLELVGAKVQVPGAGANAPSQLVESPWVDSEQSYRDLLKLYDKFSVGAPKPVAGRVNVNVASRVVLQSIPNLSARAVNQIVSLREPKPDVIESEQRHAVWLLASGVVSLQEMKQLERFVTTRGDVYSGQSIGFFDAGPIVARAEFVLDRSGEAPQLQSWRELSGLGRGFSSSELGAGRDSR